MATHAPPTTVGHMFFEPLHRSRLMAAGLLVWLAGAAYCHGYQSLVAPEHIGSWAGSLTWSAVAVVPWFALFEWSKQPHGAKAIGRPAVLAILVAAIAVASIGFEYLVDFCVGDISDRIGLLLMRRLPAIGVTMLLIAVTRKAAARRPITPVAQELAALGRTIDWVEAADNYVQLHIRGTISLRRITMRETERALAGAGFVRIHRRYLINRSRIASVAGSNGDRVVRLVDGPELPVGRAFGSNLPGA